MRLGEGSENGRKGDGENGGIGEERMGETAKRRIGEQKEKTMAERINSYKDLRVYQNALDAAMKVFELTKHFPKEEKYSLSKPNRGNGERKAEDNG